MVGRNGRPRPRSRSGRRRFFLLTVTALVTVSLAFVLGILVGRQWARDPPAKVPTEQARRPASPTRRGLSDVEAQRAPQIQEKLTFYQTLPAPLGATPPPAKPEARSRDDAAKDPGKAQPEPPGLPFTVQVGAYGSRPPADDIERKLKGAGYETYMVTISGDDGRMTYRVRVGSFATRAQAEHVAERLRGERGLAPFVTTR